MAVSRRETVREELRRLRRFLRPLRERLPQPPVPPSLPAGTVVDLRGRGEVFVRDSGPPVGASGTSQLPPVLLLHGWTVTADINFFAAYGPLAERYRVLAMDHRGHGRGMRSTEDFSLEDCADDAAALLRGLGIDRAIVVGYSMGGPIAVLLAHRHPGVVAGLVVQATALEWRASARERRFWRVLPVLDAALRLGTGEGFVVRFLRQVAEEQPNFEAFEPWLTGEFRRGYTPDIVGAGRALSRYDARSFVASLGVIAVSVVTTRDRLVRPFKQRRLATALDAPVIELQADHDAPLSCSAAYAKVTREAVDGVAERLRA
ncbi:MAG TPA: alpha/beta hydrolase [Actinomycetes bacterium]|nr:alpha/beta hydrolase [Actinomycetes bacterium]